MADEPTLIAGVEKRVAIFGGVLGILAVLVPLVVTFARLDPAIQSNATAIAELRTLVAADRATVEKEQDAQNQRFDRIEEARSVNLQRLSRVEEAVAATKDALQQINGKLDRVLMRR